MQKKIFHILLALYDSRAGKDGITYYELDDKHLKQAEVLNNRESFLKCLPTNSIAAEIGVNTGKFLDLIKKINKPKRLYLLDLWGSSRYIDNTELIVRKRFKHDISNGSIVINKGLSTNVLNDFDDNYFDWVYLDSDHGYKVTIAELKLIDKKN